MSRNRLIEYDAFAESPGGVFVESPVDCRDRMTSLLRALVFIDESTPYTEEPDVVAADRHTWQSYADRFRGKAILLAHVRSPNGNALPIWLGVMPEGVDRFIVNRPPGVIDIVDRALVGQRPSRLLISIDESGSMTRTDIEPAITGIISLLGEHTQVHVDTFTDERWLRVATSNLLQYLP